MKIFTIWENKLFRTLLIAAIWLGLWQAAYLVVRQEILIVSPLRVLQRLGGLAVTGDFWLAAGASVWHIAVGFLLAVAAGAALAVASARIPFVYELFYPILSIIKATPVASFIILAWVWMKSDSVPAFTSFLMVLPIVWGNVYNGIKKTDPNLLEMARCFEFGPAKTVQRVYLPSVMPYFTASCTTGMGLAWKAGIAAEVLAHTKHSIGGQIYDAKIYIETADLFAWTAVVIVASVVLEKAMVWILKKAGSKYNVGLD